nr:PRKC apoptosis WT1 regulator protein [Anser cygnoides]
MSNRETCCRLGTAGLPAPLHLAPDLRGGREAPAPSFTPRHARQDEAHARRQRRLPGAARTERPAGGSRAAFTAPARRPRPRGSPAQVPAPLAYRAGSSRPCPARALAEGRGRGSRGRPGAAPSGPAGGGAAHLGPAASEAPSEARSSGPAGRQGGRVFAVRRASLPAPVSPAPPGPSRRRAAAEGLGRAAPAKEPPPPPGLAGGRGAEPAAASTAVPGSPEGEEKPAGKGKGSGPSARKGKGQIEKRKLREKRRSTGVVNIPAAESLDEYEDDEAGQKERKKEDAITQQNTIQNESSSADTTGSYLLQDSSRVVSSRYKSTANAPEDDALNRYSRTERTTYSRYSRDTNSSGSSVPSTALEKRIEELERELAKERQENLRLMKMTQDKEELIGKLKEEIDLLNRDLDDIEDENEQLKQENKTLLKVVGQLTR